MTPLLPYRHRAKVTTNYSSDYADASEIIRRMENQRDVHNSQHEESVKTLEKSLRNTMRMVNHSEAVHESYYRALHDQKKRHLQGQDCKERGWQWKGRRTKERRWRRRTSAKTRAACRAIYSIPHCARRRPAPCPRRLTARTTTRRTALSSFHLYSDHTSHQIPFMSHHLGH